MQADGFDEPELAGDVDEFGFPAELTTAQAAKALGVSTDTVLRPSVRGSWSIATRPRRGRDRDTASRLSLCDSCVPLTRETYRPTAKKHVPVSSLAVGD